MKKMMLVGVMGVLVAGLGLAGELRPLGAEQQGYYNATHAVELEAATFAGLATNLGYTETFAVPAGTRVRFVAYQCVLPLTGSEGPAFTNHVFGDATVAFGTEDAATAYMAAKQCGTNTTVWWFDGTPVTATSLNTNTATATSWGTTYSATTNLMVTVALGNGLHSLGWATHGKIRLLLDVRKPYGK